jgi:hypothetical protein
MSALGIDHIQTPQRNPKDRLQFGKPCQSAVTPTLQTARHPLHVARITIFATRCVRRRRRHPRKLSAQATRKSSTTISHRTKLNCTFLLVDVRIMRCSSVSLRYFSGRGDYIYRAGRIPQNVFAHRFAFRRPVGCSGVQHALGLSTVDAAGDLRSDALRAARYRLECTCRAIRISGRRARRQRAQKSRCATHPPDRGRLRQNSCSSAGSHSTF